MAEKYECQKCRKVFATLQGLRRHENRVRPCMEPKSCRCECGKQFSLATNLYRHKRTCTLSTVQQKPATLCTSQIASGAAVMVTNSSLSNSNVTVTQNITIVPFTEEPITISWDEIRAVFGGVPNLQKLAAEEAVPRIVTALMEVVRAKHRDPRERNLRINSARTDLVQVLMPTEQGTDWITRPLVEAVAILFLRIARGWCASGADWNPLHQPKELKEQARYAGELVSRSPTDYAQRGRAPVTALLCDEAAGRGTAVRPPAAAPALRDWPPPDWPTPFRDCPITVTWEAASAVVDAAPADFTPDTAAEFVVSLIERAMAPRTERRVMLNRGGVTLLSIVADASWEMMKTERVFEALCRKAGRDLAAFQPAEGRPAACLERLRRAGASLERRAAEHAEKAREGLLGVLGRLLDATPEARRAELHMP